MRCPQCGRAITIEAVTHSCGWKARSDPLADVAQDGEPVVVAKSQAVEKVHASHERIQEHLAAMRALTGAKAPNPLAKEKPLRRRDRVHSLPEVVPGHGPCTCEQCWAARRVKRQADAVVEARAAELRRALR